LENRGAADFESATYDFNRNVLPQLGEVEVAKLTRPRLESWRAQLAARPRLSQKKPRKPRKRAKKEIAVAGPIVLTQEQKRKRQATVNRTVRRLVAALNHKLENGKVNVNPMAWKIAPFENAEVARPGFLNEAQQRAFVTACAAEPDFQNLVLAALHSGCRLGELSRMRMQDAPDGSASQTSYVQQSKSGRSRHVFLQPEGNQFFAWLAANRLPDELLLLRANGDAWTRHAVKKPMRRACKRAKIPRLGFHQLRHSFATRLLTQKVQMKIVAQQLGHTSVRMLERYYGHMVDEHVQQVIAQLPATGLNTAAQSGSGNVIVLARKASA
jgi:integrase